MNKLVSENDKEKPLKVEGLFVQNGRQLMEFVLDEIFFVQKRFYLDGIAFIVSQSKSFTRQHS